MNHVLALHQNNSRRDPAGTRHRILTAAIEEFRCGGLAGARVDSIARRAQTNERMLYYYFGNKEQLFVAVVEEVYQKFADAQASMDLSHDAPELAMRRFVRFIWEYCYLHPEVVRVINNENLQEGVHLRSSGARNAMRPVIAALSTLLERGIDSGAFHHRVDPLHFYLAISGLGYYLVSNRFTLHAAFARDPAEPNEREGLLTLHLDMLLAYLRCDEVSSETLERHLDAGAASAMDIGADGAATRDAAFASSGARGALQDPRMHRAPMNAGGATQSAASFFPGVARLPGAERGGVAPSAANASPHDAMPSDGGHGDAPVGQASALHGTAPTSAAFDREEGNPGGKAVQGGLARSGRSPAATASVTAVSSSASRATSDDAALGERAAVFWPKSRFPSL
jgi:AcrR family transcriptional regulator